MSDVKVLFLDAQTKDKVFRMTSFGDNLSGIASEFMDWISIIHATQEDMWYADIFESSGRENTRHIASLEIISENEAVIVPAPADSKVKPYIKKLTLIERIQDLFYRIKDFFSPDSDPYGEEK